MKNKEKNQQDLVILPEGFHCARFQCSDCVFFDTTTSNKYNECYCPKIGKYVPADDYTCKEFIWKK